MNEDSTLECCEVLSDDNIVSRVTCGSEETKNFEECPASDEENLVTHQKLSLGDALVRTEALLNYLEQEDESMPADKMILRNLRSIIRRRVNEKQKQLLLFHSSQNSEWTAQSHKAHIGIAGNEAADKAAKEASNKPSIDLHLGLTERSLKTLFKQKLLEKWQSSWEDPNNNKGRYTFVLFPRVSKSRYIYNRYIIQAATNHGLCPFYLRRFNIKACTCRCGEDTSDNILHFIQHCPLLCHLRFHINPTHSTLHITNNSLTSKELVSIRNFVQERENDIFQLED
ncbi:hypothetical protein AVEN_196752-1 [Araneus ventricosus]|uniref:RNase H type-1 domain-containing protein n=1 Tax=Araneus ventricosus TaxID=182803 RepID=A0A4Y2IG27_ARAVE|nr:hypothetical protein AVEN_196752-1 [Araneus ventricosus]